MPQLPVIKSSFVLQYFKKKQISDNNLKPVLASIEYKISSDFNNKFMKGETTNT
jgi:hypothetical protein